MKFFFVLKSILPITLAFLFFEAVYASNYDPKVEELQRAGWTITTHVNDAEQRIVVLAATPMALNFLSRSNRASTSTTSTQSLAASWAGWTSWANSKRYRVCGMLVESLLCSLMSILCAAAGPHGFDGFAHARNSDLGDCSICKPVRN